MADSTTLRVPSHWGAGAVLLFIGTLAGFFLGRLTAPGDTAALVRDNSVGKHPINPVFEDSDEDGEEVLNDFKDINDEYKLVLVVRTDLGMTKGEHFGLCMLELMLIDFLIVGKIAAQCSHATLACYKTLLRTNQSLTLQRWESRGQAKVSVQVKSEDELLILQAQAMSLGICAKVIHDAGRTQIASGSATVLGIGPGPKSIVDQVTGGLKLL
jgi:peptidyl-tRNA hydrolase, PTH2 family